MSRRGDGTVTQSAGARVGHWESALRSDQELALVSGQLLLERDWQAAAGSSGLTGSILCIQVEQVVRRAPPVCCRRLSAPKPNTHLKINKQVNQTWTEQIPSDEQKETSPV